MFHFVSPGSGVLIVLFYKGLTKNQIENASCLSFVPYLETGTNQEYQIWHEGL